MISGEDLRYNSRRSKWKVGTWWGFVETHPQFSLNSPEEFSEVLLPTDTFAYNRSNRWFQAVYFCPYSWWSQSFDSSQGEPKTVKIETSVSTRARLMTCDKTKNLCGGRKTGVFAIYGQKDPCSILSENFNLQPAKIFRSAKLKGNFVHRETIKMVNVEVSIPVGKLSSFLNRPIPYPRTFSYYTIQTVLKQLFQGRNPGQPAVLTKRYLLFRALYWIHSYSCSLQGRGDGGRFWLN